MRDEFLKEFQRKDIRQFREKYPQINKYLDEEIANCFSWYCELFHAASWTTVEDNKFIEWAFTLPIDNFKVKD